MKRVFADTAYWLALTNSFDQYHTKAVEVSEILGSCRLFTTDLVLTEFLNALADKGPHLRAAVVEMVETILRNPHVIVIPTSRRTFMKSLALYKARPDKGYKSHRLPLDAANAAASSVGSTDHGSTFRAGRLCGLAARVNSAIANRLINARVPSFRQATLHASLNRTGQ